MNRKINRRQADRWRETLVQKIQNFKNIRKINGSISHILVGEQGSPRSPRVTQEKSASKKPQRHHRHSPRTTDNTTLHTTAGDRVLKTHQASGPISTAREVPQQATPNRWPMTAAHDMPILLYPMIRPLTPCLDLRSNFIPISKPLQIVCSIQFPLPILVLS